MLQLFDIKRLFCGTAIAGALLLCGLDFATSYKGIAAFIPPGNRSPLLALCPFVFAALAISINALSAWLFKMFDHQEFTEFSKSFLVLCFMSFLAYDGISSFVGMLAEFYGQPLTSLQSILDAYHNIGMARAILSGAIATLASFSPLLVSVFWDLWQSLGDESETASVALP